ncbi:MAG TPA: hypothetical protein VNZ53_06510 [Steroidobacteraceae bacterium]|jgi:hypothetical protein|nr:hypothetical protein [Steroidobacteraceae bacterium]
MPEKPISLSAQELADKCTTPDEARNLIKNARARGKADIRAVWEGLYAYEDIVLSCKHCRNQAAGRTRQFVREHGAYDALLLWARRKTGSEGFRALVEAGHPEITAEYLVAVTFFERFPDDARENAERRLREAGVQLPTISRDSAAAEVSSLSNVMPHHTTAPPHSTLCAPFTVSKRLSGLMFKN